MPQAKFSLTKEQFDFINEHELWGYKDRSSLVREAIDQFKARLAERRLAESADLYAEVYAGDDELQRLTDAALEDWPK